MAFLVLFVSCEQYDNVNNSTDFSGEELFKSIIFSDGKLANQLPALASISQLDRMSYEELLELRTYEDEIINYLFIYLKKTNKNYFTEFKSEMYSQNPELISSAISKTAKDIIPWVNDKLAIHGMTVDEVARSVKLDENGNLQPFPDVSIKQACGVLVWVAAVAVVAVAAIWVVAISSVAVVGAQQLNADRSITQEAISIQIAESLAL